MQNLHPLFQYLCRHPDCASILNHMGIKGRTSSPIMDATICTRALSLASFIGRTDARFFSDSYETKNIAAKVIDTRRILGTTWS